MPATLPDERIVEHPGAITLHPDRHATALALVDAIGEAGAVEVARSILALVGPWPR